MTRNIKHQGTVASINGHFVSVRIMQASACASCVAKQLCHSAESKEKFIEVFATDASSYSVGEQVMVMGHLSQGLKAVFWAYCLPLILIVATLYGTFVLCHDEALSALVSILILFPYYLIIYMHRSKFSKTLSFTLKHQI